MSQEEPQENSNDFGDYVGYQILSQNENTENLDEPEDENEVKFSEKTAEISDPSTGQSSSEIIDINIPFSPEHVARIKAVASKLTFPNQAIPEWAKKIPEDKLLNSRKEKLNS